LNARCLWSALLIAGIAAGTIGDRPRTRPPLTLGGWRVLAADFHTHTSYWSDGALTPIGLASEAARQGLDAVAVTGHVEVGDAKVARWWSRLVGGPTVLVGEEIVAPHHHVIAIGIEDVVDADLPVARQIDEVHRQGGVAIAAHPSRSFWPGFDADALARLDGAEVAHPAIYDRAGHQREFADFLAKGRFAAIGSSDFHGLERVGICRTYVFAKDATAGAILDAIRARRTVVYGLDGQPFGDPALIDLAATHPELRLAATTDPPPPLCDWISRIAALLGLLGLALGRARGVSLGAAPRAPLP
jgi:hypothetical protein